jgi:uncharacterized protein (TIGR02266 family)
MTAAHDAAERPSSPRLALEVEVSLTSEAYFYGGLSGDPGGVFVPTYQLRPVGRSVEVAFKLPSGTARARGRVRWLRDAHDGASPGIGIAFEELGDADRVQIEEMCRARSPIYYDVDE